jgi:hypothetical protein
LREGGDLQPLDIFAGGETKEKTVEEEEEKRDNLPRSGPHERQASVVFGVVGSGLKQRLQAAVSGSH